MFWFYVNASYFSFKQQMQIYKTPESILNSIWT